MLEMDIIRKKRLVRVGLNYRFYGNRFRQSGVNLLEGHTPDI